MIFAIRSRGLALAARAEGAPPKKSKLAFFSGNVSSMLRNLESEWLVRFASPSRRRALEARAEGALGKKKANLLFF